MLRKFNLVIVLIGLILLSGCGSSEVSKDLEDSEIEKASAYCVEQNGTVKELVQNSITSSKICVTKQTGDFDGGSEEYTYTCGLMDFYNGTCDKDDEDNSSLLQVVPSGYYQSMAYYQEVDTILKNLDNTGYTHRPFMLSPDINESGENYNLFLDCSGFVGYYVVQKLSLKLYNKLPRKYSCGPLSEEDNVTSSVARPLAADFVDFIKTAPEVTRDNSSTTDDDKDNQCWGRVTDLKDALPGDIIAYVHNGNIDTSTQYCCHKVLNDDNTAYRYTSTEMGTDDVCESPSRIIYKTKLENGHRKSTGHVMFITKKPYRSTKRTDKETYGDSYPKTQYQWRVRVADSTNVIHSSDTRYVGEDNSEYEGNKYHAWTHGTVEKYADGRVEKCADGSYHRKCAEHDTEQIDDVYVDIKGSSKPNHPTGIGMGYIYVNDAMDGYRTKYSADISHADVVIGRPIRCQ